MEWIIAGIAVLVVLDFRFSGPQSGKGGQTVFPLRKQLVRTYLR